MASVCNISVSCPFGFSPYKSVYEKTKVRYFHKKSIHLSCMIMDECDANRRGIMISDARLVNVDYPSRMCLYMEYIIVL